MRFLVTSARGEPAVEAPADAAQAGAGVWFWRNPCDAESGGSGLQRAGEYWAWFLGRLQTDRVTSSACWMALKVRRRVRAFDRAAMEQTSRGWAIACSFCTTSTRKARRYLNRAGRCLSARADDAQPNQSADGCAGGSGRRRSVAAKFGCARGRAHWRCGACGFSSDGRGGRGCESGAGNSTRPALPPAIPQYFVPARDGGEEIVYEPMLRGARSASLTRKRRLI